MVDYKLPECIHDFDEVYDKDARLEYEETLDYTMRFKDSPKENNMPESPPASSFRTGEAMDV